MTAWSAPNNGRVYLFLGPSSGTIAAADADLVIHGGQRDVRFGYHAAAVGDLTGDGVPDLLVSAQASRWNGRDGGAVYLFSGADLLGAM